MKKIVKSFFGFSVVWLLFACSDSLTDAQHVEKAQGHLDRGELEAASIELKNALQQNQGNAQARWLLGKLYLELGDAVGAEKELLRAKELGVMGEAVLPLLSQALLSGGKYQELQKLSSENFTAKDKKAMVLAAQGLGNLAQGKIEAGEEQIKQAVSLDTQSAYVGVARARLLAAKQEYDLARKELDRVLALDPDYASAWSEIGDLEGREMNLALAETAYTKAAENRVNNFTDLLKRASVRIKQKKYDAAQKDIDVLKKRAPQHAGVNYEQGLIHFRNNQLPEAQLAFEQTLKGNNRHFQAMFFLGLAHFQQRNLEQAEKYGSQFLAVVPRSVSGRKLLASIYIEKREYAATEKLIRPVVDSLQNDLEALNLLASALLQQNKTDEAIELLEKVTTLEPDSATAQLRLGLGLLANGEQAKGVERIERALEIDPEIQQAHVALVLNYLKQSAFGKALEAAEIYRDRNPNTALPYNLLGRLYLVLGDIADAGQAFSRSREIAPGDPAANHGLASLAIKDKEYQRARAYYQDVLEDHANHLATLLALAGLDALENQEQAMVDRLQQASAAHPEVVQPKLMLARYNLKQGAPEKVLATLLELSVKQKNTPAVLELIALSQLALKQFSSAKLTLQKLIEKQPSFAHAHFLLAQVHAGLKDDTGLREELHIAIELEPRHSAARLALARLMLLDGQKEKVKEQLAILDKLFPDHSDVLRLKAALARVEGDQKTASGLLEDVFEKSPSTASMLSVASQKWGEGDWEGSLELQKQWAEKHPDDLQAILALAGSYAQQNQVDQAIAQYQWVVENEEKNIVALNDLAWHLRDTQPAKALAYAERASKIAPESTLVMDTLAVVLWKNGDVERAKRNIERALAKNPKNPAIRYHSAMINASAGDKATAIKVLETLLGENADFPDKAEAERLLADLQSGAYTFPR